MSTQGNPKFQPCVICHCFPCHCRDGALMGATLTKQAPLNIAAPFKKAPHFRLTLAQNGWIIRTGAGELIVARDWADLSEWLRVWTMRNKNEGFKL